HIGALIGARHSHLDNAGYSIDQKRISSQEASPDRLVEALLAEERWRQVLSSLVVCFFARGIYQVDVVLRALNVAGFSLTEKDLKSIAGEIHREKYRFKIREGFSFEGLDVPRRVLDTATPLGRLDDEYIKSAVKHFAGLMAHRAREQDL
ncbi:MAG: aldehyde:ferredoxin oxidoreductase, partial [Dehalococcoidia bacterium]|nr:aldehyde:ferredoxin oxidoreductase [Dehalococcoidia bacterium]